MLTTRQYLKDIGSRSLVDATGLSHSLLHRAREENVFPATWFRDFTEFCAEHDLPPPPMHLFKWRKRRVDG